MSRCQLYLPGPVCGEPAVWLGAEPDLPAHAAVPADDGLGDVHRAALADLLLNRY